MAGVPEGRNASASSDAASDQGEFEHVAQVGGRAWADNGGAGRRRYQRPTGVARSKAARASSGAANGRIATAGAGGASAATPAGTSDASAFANYVILGL